MNFNNIVNSYKNVNEKRDILNDINQSSSENSTDTSKKYKKKEYKQSIKKEKKDDLENKDLYKIDFTKIYSKFIIDRINKQLETEDFLDFYLNY